MISSTASLPDQLAMDVQGTETLRAKARAGDAKAMSTAAREFEAMVVNMMLRTMRQTKFEDPDNALFGSQSTQFYQDMLDQQWSRKVTEGHGFGLADMLMRQIKAQQKTTVTEPATAQAGATSVAPQSNIAPLGDVTAAGTVWADEKAPTSSLPESAHQFMQHMRPFADAAAQRLGVPAEYVLAHAGLESGWGQREIKRIDGSPSYNLFGIKAGKSWQGDAAQSLTTEYQYGLPVKKAEPFRAYGGYAEAFDDYASLLKQRYADALGTADAKKFSYGLQQGGYASDPRYGEKLSRLIGRLT